MKRMVNKVTAMILLAILFVFAFVITDNIYSSETGSEEMVVIIQKDAQTGEEITIVVTEAETLGVGLFTTPTTYVNSINPNPLPDPPDTTGHH